MNKNMEGKSLMGKIIFVIIAAIIFYFIVFQKNMIISDLENEIQRLEKILNDNNINFSKEEKKDSKENDRKEEGENIKDSVEKENKEKVVDSDSVDEVIKNNDINVNVIENKNIEDNQNSI